MPPSTLYFYNSVTLPEMSYTYDALYRLLQANGREQIGSATFGTYDNYNDSAWMGIAQPGNDLNTQNYTEYYAYDAVGNIESLQHVATVGSYTRSYTYDTASNRLLSTVVGGGSPYTYSYDSRGNIVQMPNLSAITYSTQNEMAAADLIGGGMAYYQYTGGQRGRKAIVNGTQLQERIYLGGWEVYRTYLGGTLTLQRSTVHISDDTGRIAMYEVRTFGSDPSPATLPRYIYSNNLGSAALELDNNANIISYEEYRPYGTTAYQAMNTSINAVAKRYRYTGKERDDETGLYYHGARYYCCWLARWMAVDPICSETYNVLHGHPRRSLERSFVALTASNYEYCYDNPIVYKDPSGEWGTPEIAEIDPRFEQDHLQGPGGRMLREDERDDFYLGNVPKPIVVPGAGTFYFDYNPYTGASAGLVRAQPYSPGLTFPGQNGYPDPAKFTPMTPEQLDKFMQNFNEHSRNKPSNGNIPYEKITNDIDKLKGADLAAMSHRLRSNTATPNDKLLASQLRAANKMYEIHPKHDPADHTVMAKDASVVPENHASLWDKSVYDPKTNSRWAVEGKGKHAVFHRFLNNNNGTWHWSGSTKPGLNKQGYKVAPITLDIVPSSIKKLFASK